MFESSRSSSQLRKSFLTMYKIKNQLIFPRKNGDLRGSTNEPRRFTQWQWQKGRMETEVGRMSERWRINFGCEIHHILSYSPPCNLKNRFFHAVSLKARGFMQFPPSSFCHMGSTNLGQPSMLSGRC